MNHLLSINTDYCKNFVHDTEIEASRLKALDVLANMRNKKGEGSEFLGWMDLPNRMDDRYLNAIEESVHQLKEISDTVVVIGIGGSYLGSKAVISALSPSIKTNGTYTEILFAGKDISGREMEELLSHVAQKAFSIVVISKSGTTTEPAIAFRLLKQKLMERHTKDFNQRIVAITDATRGALRKQADANGWTTFDIPDDVGGRFSVLSAVGLLPIALSGINIREIVHGAARGLDLLNATDHNPAIEYAVFRNQLLQRGYLIEILANYEPRLGFLAEWWKQLYGESEGKAGKGIFPASVGFTADLHSLGQYIQGGPRHLMVSTLHIQNSNSRIRVNTDTENLDGLNYLSGKTLDEINATAMEATIQAHHAGGVPNILISLEKLDAFHIGYLLFFFECACSISAYLLAVNPFDQPGVEAYKKKMFELLGKPGI